MRFNSLLIVAMSFLFTGCLLEGDWEYYEERERVVVVDHGPSSGPPPRHNERPREVFTPAPVPVIDPHEEMFTLIDLVNSVRVSGTYCHGVYMRPVRPLRADNQLMLAAYNHAYDMASRNYYGHFTPEGAGPDDRAWHSGYRGFTGENIAAGAVYAEEALEQWLGSYEHCMNMMDPNYRDIGVGYVIGGYYGHYWVQMLGH